MNADPLEGLLAAALAAPPSAGATAVIAIDGRSAAGKSALAARLAARLAAPVVSLEDLYGGWDGLQDGIERLRREVLEPLAGGRLASVPRYDWHAGAWGPRSTLAPPRRLIVEGVGAGARELAPFTGLLVWLEAPAAQRRARALARDGAEVYGEAEWERWAALEDGYIARHRPGERADVVLADPPRAAAERSARPTLDSHG